MIVSKENLIKCKEDNLIWKSIIEGFSLAKWELLNRLKKKEKTEAEKTRENKESKENQNDAEPASQQEEQPITVYNETLYSKDSRLKPTTADVSKEKKFFKRTSWENADIIEQNIDRMRRKRTERKEHSEQPGENTEKKVDYILLKKKTKL
jgi:hypothetical protein